MTSYAITLFFHIIGALGFFVALGVEWLSVRQMRRAGSAEQVQLWLKLTREVGRIGMASMLTLLISGFVMMAMSWGGVAWIIVSLATIALMAIIAVTLSGRRMAALSQAANAEAGALSLALRHALQHPLLWFALQTRVALALSIVFLMTVKPDMLWALMTVGIAAVIGMLASLPFPTQRRAPAEPSL